MFPPTPLTIPYYLQFDHPAVKDIFVCCGCTVGLQHVACVGHPVLQLFEPLGKHLVFGDYPVDS